VPEEALVAAVREILARHAQAADGAS
jgi:hypothetical protein